MIWSPAPVVDSPWADGAFIKLSAPVVPVDVPLDDPQLWENELSYLWTSRPAQTERTRAGGHDVAPGAGRGCHRGGCRVVHAGRVPRADDPWRSKGSEWAATTLRR